MAIGMPDNKQGKLFETEVTPLMQEAEILFADVNHVIAAEKTLTLSRKSVSSLLPRIRQLLPRLRELGFKRDEQNLRQEWRASVQAEKNRAGDFGDGEVAFETFVCWSLVIDSERLRKIADGEAETVGEAADLIEEDLRAMIGGGRYSVNESLKRSHPR